MATGDHDADASCGRTSLDVGAVAHEAEIKLTAEGPVLVSIELLTGDRR